MVKGDVGGVLLLLGLRRLVRGERLTHAVDVLSASALRGGAGYHPFDEAAQVEQLLHLVPARQQRTAHGFG